MYLPVDVVKSMYNRVQAVVDTSSGSITAYVPCVLASQDRAVDFTFSGIKISVPFNEIVLPSNGPDGLGLHFDDGKPACVFGIAPSNGGPSVLGDTFLRSAYVVYDLAHNQISLAQTNFNSTTDNIKEIEEGPAGVPGATMVPSPITSARGIGTGAARLAAVATSTVTVVSGASAQASTNMSAIVCLMFALLMGMDLSA